MCVQCFSGNFHLIGIFFADYFSFQGILLATVDNFSHLSERFAIELIAFKV